MIERRDDDHVPAESSDEPAQRPEERESGHGQRLNTLQVIGSVLAAAFGVQSSKNRERDFRHGRPVVFIAAGLVFTALFIGAVYTIVSLVLSTR